MPDRKESKESIVKIVGIPAISAGAGALVGALGGGYATRKILETPGVRARLLKMTPEQKRKFLQTAQRIGAGVAGSASALGSYALSEHIRDKMEKREGKK
jgi:hypothetical protein